MGMECACQYGAWTSLAGFHLMHADVVDTWVHVLTWNLVACIQQRLLLLSLGLSQYTFW